MLRQNLRIARILLIASNGLLLAVGAGLTAIAVYVITDPHLGNMYGATEISQLCYSFLFVGMSLFAAAILGCYAIARKERRIIYYYLSMLGCMAVGHIICGHEIYATTDSFLVDRCLGSVQSGQNLNSEACNEFIHSKAYISSYFLWQQVWAEAMKPMPDVSAQNILQEVQDEFHCCGFHDKKSCHQDLSLAKWMIDGTQPRQRCSEQHPAEFCYNLAHSDGHFVSHCSIRTEWDFPYGTYDECQDKNQQSGKGCAVHFTRYMNSTIRKSVNRSYWIVFCEAICIAAAAVLYQMKPNSYAPISMNTMTSVPGFTMYSASPAPAPQFGL
jgi:hypothetical protein